MLGPEDNKANQELEAKRRRVAKACDYCRKKKIKCDGGNPCGNCNVGRVVCYYVTDERKKPTRKPNSNTRTLKEMDLKLNRLQKIIEDLVGSIRPQGFEMPQYEKRFGKSHKNKSLSSLGTGSSYSESSNTDESESDVSDSYIKKDVQKGIVKAKLDSTNLRIKSHMMDDDYIEDHVFCSVFSSAGFKWVSSKLGVSGPLRVYSMKAALQRGHSLFHKSFQNMVQAKDQIQLRPFPEDKVLYFCMDIFEKIAFFKLVCSREDVEPSIIRFIEARRVRNYNQVTNTDYLLIGIVISLALFYIQKLDVSSQEQANQFGLTVEILPKLEEDYLQVTLHYYHRLALIGENFNTIRAMLLLSFYLGCCFSAKNSMVIATTVRLAQDLALHRTGSYRRLSPREALRKRNVWVACMIIDKEVTITSGKPPVIHDEDCDVMMPVDFKNQMYINFPQYFKDQDVSDEKRFIEQLNVFGMSEPSGFWYLASYLKLGICMIGSKCYSLLLSATSEVSQSQFSIDNAGKILKKIAILNDEIEAWRERVPGFLKHNTKETYDAFVAGYHIWENDRLDSRRFFGVSLFSYYYYHIMIVHRIAYLTLWKSSDAHLRPLRLEHEAATWKCFKAAKGLLLLSSEFNEVFYLMRNGLAVFVISAYFTVFTGVVAYPSHPEALDSILLMITCERQYFSTFAVEGDIYESLRFLICEAVFISLDIYKEHQGTSYETQKDKRACIDNFYQVHKEYCKTYKESLTQKLKEKMPKPDNRFLQPPQTTVLPSIEHLAKPPTENTTILLDKNMSDSSVGPLIRSLPLKRFTKSSSPALLPLNNMFNPTMECSLDPLFASPANSQFQSNLDQIALDNSNIRANQGLPPIFNNNDVSAPNDLNYGSLAELLDIPMDSSSLLSQALYGAPSLSFDDIDSSWLVNAVQSNYDFSQN